MWSIYDNYYKILLIFTLICCPLMGFCEEVDPKAAAAEMEKRIYRLYPDFVSNLKYTSQQHRYVHVRVEILAKTEADAKLLKYYEPLLQDHFLRLLNNTPYDELRGVRGKKHFQKETHKTLQKILYEELNREIIETVSLRRFILE